MNKNKVYISLFSMIADKKGYIRLFFKILLLAVYFAFFSVQLFLRYSSSHSLQSLDLDNCKKVIASKEIPHDATISAKDSKKNKNLSYLNKRFHPQDEVTVPCLDIQIGHYYSETKTSFSVRDVHIDDAIVHISSLRGPPAAA